MKTKPNDRQLAPIYFPALPARTALNWEQALETLRASNAMFRETVAQLADSQLDDPLSSSKKSVYIEVHGVIQHHLYHAGQIALLKKNFAIR